MMKRVKAKYALGLTATPERKDGRHSIIYMRWRVAHLSSFAYAIPTVGAPSLRFLQGWAAMLRTQLLSVPQHRLCMPSSYPPFAEYAKDGAPAHLWWLLQFESRATRR
jgi:hypothetical protein